MADPQPLLFRILIFECDRCQFRVKGMRVGEPPWELPEGWRKENGYTLCGGCDMNALEHEYREAITPIKKFPDLIDTIRATFDYAEFDIENAGGSDG